MAARIPSWFPTSMATMFTDIKHDTKFSSHVASSTSFYMQPSTPQRHQSFTPPTTQSSTPQHNQSFIPPSTLPSTPQRHQPFKPRNRPGISNLDDVSMCVDCGRVTKYYCVDCNKCVCNVCSTAVDPDVWENYCEEGERRRVAQCKD